MLIISENILPSYAVLCCVVFKDVASLDGDI